MAEKKIVIDISENGEIKAETFGYQGVSCVDELDKLMKDIAVITEKTHKPEFFKEGITSDTTVKVNQK